MRADGSIFVDDIAKLRAKLQRLTGHAGDLWRELRARARSGANPWEAAFVALVTGGEAEARIFRDFLLARVKAMWDEDATDRVQVHTWCVAAPVTQLAILYDWTCNGDLFDAAEQEAAADAFVDFAFRHPYVVAKSRLPSSDNQLCTMLLCGAVVGYLFGYKRARSQRAQEIFTYCFSRFDEALASAGPDGYSLEGSAYMSRIQVPTVTLMAALWEWLTGAGDISRRALGPHGVSILDIIRVYYRTIGPDGLLPAWDNYGFEWASSTMAMAWLARKTSIWGYLAPAVRAGLWRRPARIMHGPEVDRIWTLLWWPDELEDVPDAAPSLTSWALPDTAASLEYEGTRTRLFQVWDGADRLHRRLHTNPNSVTFEAMGSPLIVEGMPGSVAPCPRPLQAPADVVLRDMSQAAQERLLGYTRVLNYSRGAGSVQEWLDRAIVGALTSHNVIIIDDAAWYTPPSLVHGHAVGFGALPGLAVVESESAPFYQPQFNARSVRRRSVLVEGRWVVIEDDVRAGSPHRFTWQAFLRPNTRRPEAAVAWTETPEGTGMYTVSLDRNPFEVERIEGYPDRLEGASARLRRSTTGRHCRFRTLLFPVVNHRLVAKLPLTRHDEAQDGSRRLVYEFDAPASAGELEAKILVDEAPAGIQVVLNERALPVDTTAAARTSDGFGASLVPLPVRVPRRLLRERGNVLEITIPPSTNSSSPAAVRLVEIVGYPRMPRIVSHHCTVALVEPDRTCHVLIFNPGRKRRRVGPLLTDADCARVRGFEEWTVLGATTLSTPDMSLLESSTRVDVECDQRGIQIARISPSSELTVRLPSDGSRLRLRGGSVLEIRAERAWVGRRVELPYDAATVYRCNGKTIVPEVDPLAERCAFVIIPAGRAKAANWGGSYAERIEAVFHGRHQDDAESAEALLAALHDPDWRVRMAAAESIGRRRLRSAVPRLATLLGSLLDRSDGVCSQAHEGRAALPDRFRTKLALICALAEIEDPSVLEDVAAVLRRPEEFYALHVWACIALGRMGGPQHLELLSEWAEHVEVNTRRAAQAAIGQIQKRFQLRRFPSNKRRNAQTDLSLEDR